MAVKNFIPALWSAKILKEMDKKKMLVAHCNREYSGEIQNVGDTVHINNLMRPTIGDYVAGSTSITPEAIMDESRVLTITQAKYFAITLEKTDKKQGTKGILEEAMRLAADALQDAAEVFIAGKYTEAGLAVTQSACTSGNILSTLTEAKRKLMEENVLNDSDIVLEVSPMVWEKIVLAGIVYMDNGVVMKEGTIAPVLGIKVFVSNNIVTSSTLSHCIMRTKRAVAFAEQIMEVKKYEPEAKFSEAVKGLHVYGARVILPNEMVHLAITVAAETVI